MECVGERGVCVPADVLRKLWNRGGGGVGGGETGADDHGHAVGRSEAAGRWDIGYGIWETLLRS